MKSVLPSWHVAMGDHKPLICPMDAPFQVAGLVQGIQNAISQSANFSLDFIIVQEMWSSEELPLCSIQPCPAAPGAVGRRWQSLQPTHGELHEGSIQPEPAPALFFRRDVCTLLPC